MLLESPFHGPGAAANSGPGVRVIWDDRRVEREATIKGDDGYTSLWADLLRQTGAP